MKLATAIFTSLVVLLPHTSQAESPTDLKPLMVVPDKVVLQEDFSEAKPLKKGVWQSRQGTRWAIEDGLLRGKESSAEFQAARKDHFGYEPRLSIPVTPANFAASFSFRFVDGKETAIVPFIEFGHHVCRIRFGQNGTILIADHETMKLAEAKEFVWESGKWYHALAEMKGDQFVMQIADGPTLYAQRKSFAEAPTSGGNGFGIAGPRKGIVEIDNLAISSIKDTEQPNWKERAAKFPKFDPVQIKEPKSKKPQSKKPNTKKTRAK
jgi:hypothetical protein